MPLGDSEPEKMPPMNARTSASVGMPAFLYTYLTPLGMSVTTMRTASSSSSSSARPRNMRTRSAVSSSASSAMAKSTSPSTSLPPPLRAAKYVSATGVTAALTASSLSPSVILSVNTMHTFSSLMAPRWMASGSSALAGHGKSSGCDCTRPRASLDTVFMSPPASTNTSVGMPSTSNVLDSDSFRSRRAKGTAFHGISPK
mmetsp:Transcript_25993/g.90495  ORF Transcript_25993/g.90495 Transcript_25993/m.90495 type:complete len:200 (-) Transcript_25993:871-1470(-)